MCCHPTTSLWFSDRPLYLIDDLFLRLSSQIFSKWFIGLFWQVQFPICSPVYLKINKTSYLIFSNNFKSLYFSVICIPWSFFFLLLLIIFLGGKIFSYIWISLFSPWLRGGLIWKWNFVLTFHVHTPICFLVFFFYFSSFF